MLEMNSSPYLRLLTLSIILPLLAVKLAHAEDEHGTSTSPLTHDTGETRDGGDGRGGDGGGGDGHGGYGGGGDGHGGYGGSDDGRNDDGNGSSVSGSSTTGTGGIGATGQTSDGTHRRFGDIVSLPVLDPQQTKAVIAAGRAASMTLLLTYLNQNYPGQVLDVRLHSASDGYVYEVRYLANVIVLRTLFLDAATLKAK
jgi:hypothetical protein